MTIVGVCTTYSEQGIVGSSLDLWNIWKITLLCNLLILTKDFQLEISTGNRFHIMWSFYWSYRVHSIHIQTDWLNGIGGISYIFLVQEWFRTEVPCTPSSTWPEFELMTSRSLQYSSWHWGLYIETNNEICTGLRRVVYRNMETEIRPNCSVGLYF